MSSQRARGHRLEYDDIRAGMSLMQTVYTVAMVLGLERVVEASYELLIAPGGGLAGAVEFLRLGIVLVAILLLSIRFFWVHRNLNSYIVHFYDRLGEKVFTRMTTLHFPIALVHALLFFFICQVFAGLAAADRAEDPTAVAGYALRFVLLYAMLLMLNSVWLLSISPSRRTAEGPGRLWGLNNLGFSVSALVLVALARSLGWPTWVLIWVGSALFIANSLLDLWKAAKYYILYEDQPPG